MAAAVAPLSRVPLAATGKDVSAVALTLTCALALPVTTPISMVLALGAV
jgi:hypothetical protein